MSVISLCTTGPNKKQEQIPEARGWLLSEITNIPQKRHTSLWLRNLMIYTSSERSHRRESSAHSPFKNIGSKRTKVIFLFFRGMIVIRKQDS